MDNYLRINLDDLEFEELTYELVLRGIPVTGSIDAQKRELRARMRSEVKNNTKIESFRTVSEEYEIVPEMLEQMEINLNLRSEPAYESRLYHYLERVARAKETDDVDRGNKVILLEVICEMLRIYFRRDISLNEESFEDSLELGAVGGQSSSDSVRSVEPQGANHPDRETGTRPKSNRNLTGNPESQLNRNPIMSKFQNMITQQTKRPQNVSLPPQDPNLNREYVHISEIDSYVAACVQQKLNEQMRQHGLGNPGVEYLTRRLKTVGIQDRNNREISESVAERQFRSVIPNNLEMPESVKKNFLQQVTFNPVGNVRQTNRQMANPYRLNDETFHQFQQLPRSTDYGYQPNSGSPMNPPSNSPLRNLNRSFNLNNDSIHTRRQPYQTCNIVEKWPKFYGDSSSVPLVSFLRNIDILCRSYGIDKNELIKHAHLLFSGDASIWYTTYVDKFLDWDSLVYYLTLRYDNPNRDRFIKEEMRNRKQKQNELFSAFLTDIESLAQRLINKMSEAEKFDIIVDNMKMSYKRRLALHQIASIEDLANMCYKFDALEGSLYTPRNRPLEVHNIEEAYDSDSEYEEINALQKTRFGKMQSSTETKNKLENLEGPTEVFCWNCRNNGHFWKDCSQQKTIFCHVCGMMGKTTSTCPKQHPPFNTSARGSKNL